MASGQHSVAGTFPQIADFAIITIIKEELKAVRKMLKLTTPIRERGQRVYYSGRLPSYTEEEQHFVVCAKSRARGTNPATKLTSDILARWKPRFVLVVGIAGGVKGQSRESVALGDVVVGEK